MDKFLKSLMATSSTTKMSAPSLPSALTSRNAPQPAAVQTKKITRPPSMTSAPASTATAAPTLSPAGQSYAQSLATPAIPNQLPVPTASNLPSPAPTPPAPEKPERREEKKDAKSDYLKYLTGFDERQTKKALREKEAADKNLAEINREIMKQSLSARREEQAILDRPGMLRSGAEVASTTARRRSNQELADLAVQQQGAASMAGLAQNTYDTYINAGKTALEAEQAAQKAVRDSAFNLSEGQTRFEIDPATGQYRQVASIAEAPQSDSVLTPTEAAALGVPYGTTRSQAFGKTPQKPATEAQNKASMFALRTSDANVILDSMASGVSKMNPVSFGTQSALEDTTIGNTLVSDQMKQVKQAERNFLNSILRRESGAVISPSEFANGAKQYFPRPGDDEKTLAQKARNRTVAIEALKNEAGNAYGNVNDTLNSNQAQNNPLGI